MGKPARGVLLIVLREARLKSVFSFIVDLHIAVSVMDNMWKKDYKQEKKDGL